MTDRTLLVIAALLLGAVALASANCASHMESKLDLTRTQTVTEPVAVPQSSWWRAWRPVVPNTGGQLSPPSVMPLAPPDPHDPGFFFEGGTTYGPPQPKTTTTGEHVAAESESDKKPQIPSLLGMLLGNWTWCLLGLAALAILALVGFRKSGLVQRLVKVLPFPFSLLAIAVPETSKE